MREIRHGIRHILASPFIYDFFQSIVGANRWRRKFLQSFLLNNIPENGTVLDIGCGTCKILTFLPRTLHYIGIDRNNLYIQKAKKRYHDRKATFLCEELSINFSEIIGKVDAVLMLGVLHHLNDNECDSILSVISRILNPAGFLLALDPVYINQQQKIAKFIVSCDRGTAVRNEAGYIRITKKYFSRIDTYIDLHPIFIPYTGITMRCAV